MFRPEGLEDTGAGTGAAMRNFSRVRDRLFYALFYKLAHTYARIVPPVIRRMLEFAIMAKALFALGLLIYLHTAFANSPTETSCLAPVDEVWAKDQGVLRVEVVSNLSRSPTLVADWHPPGTEPVPTFVEHKRTAKTVLLEHPPLPPIKGRCAWKDANVTECPRIAGQIRRERQLRWLRQRESRRRMMDVMLDNSGLNEEDLEDQLTPVASPEYVFEYALEYGFLRLNPEVRRQLNIRVTTLRIDPDTDTCFGEGLRRYLRSELIGVEDVLRNSFKRLASSDDGRHGFLRNVKTDEHFKFVSIQSTRTSYIAALFVMILFTLSISMLLRYSHHQIFLFIIDVLQMLELNVGIAFPAGPLLTVILALVGIEAIMSEFFNDSTTAFYIIIIVWVADQYEAICCHTALSKRHWLKFFFLYHFAFYAYHYRFNGQYSGLALIASWLLIQHSMLYFFHHYELPAVLHHQQMQMRVNSQSENNSGTNSAPRGTTQNRTPRGGVHPLLPGAGNEDPASLEYIEHLLEELLPTNGPVAAPGTLLNPAPNIQTPTNGAQDTQNPGGFQGEFDTNNNPDLPHSNLLLYPVQNLILAHLTRFLHSVRSRAQVATVHTPTIGGEQESGN